jgi:hypothetical protein
VAEKIEIRAGLSTDLSITGDSKQVLTLMPLLSADRKNLASSKKMLTLL